MEKDRNLSYISLVEEKMKKYKQSFFKKHFELIIIIVILHAIFFVGFGLM